jgi:phage terminase large subunit
VQFLPGGTIRLIRNYSNNDVATPHYANWLQAAAQDMGITYRGHILPHDGNNRDKTTGESYANALKRLTGVDVRVFPATDVLLGLNEVRNKFPLFQIDETACAEGLRALKAYQWEKDDKANLNRAKPKHDWASHRADPLRLLAFFRPTVFQTSGRVVGGY